MSGAHVLADALLAGFDAEDELETRNPLECLVCSNEFVDPRRLPCNHSFCQRCITGYERCPLCGTVFDGELPEDSMISFLIDTSHETADVCANCDQISLPMHFCETCQQALCNECKVNTHQAKMFAAHRLVLLEERTRMRGRALCTIHNEPIILYSLESRQLVCINCFNSASLESRHHFVNLDVAHKIGCEKLEKTAGKLKNVNDDIRDRIQLRRRLLNELRESYQSQTANVNQLCQQMIDTLMVVKERLLQTLRDERDARQQHFDAQLIQLLETIPFIRLYLLASSMFCASASKLDFLETSHDLIKRIQSVLSAECIKPIYTGQLTCDVREEFARSLEPFLGLSSLLLTTANLPIGRTSESSNNGSGTASPARLSRRSGSGYVNYPNAIASTSKFQLIVDLAGAFGDQFARIDIPLRQYTIEMTNLTKEVQESQRDLTLRRCLINKERVKTLIIRCVDLEGKLGMHSALIQDLHPNLQQIWQEQLDRVRRQQIILREKIENTVNLRESARQLTMVARQLEPFACCLESVALVIDRRRCHPPDPAPMERICHEINTIAPDSQHRIEAIEKEEHNRKLAQEQKKKEEHNELLSAKRHLKTTKEHHQRKMTTTTSSNVAVRTVGRDRSRGGTDRAMMSPHKRRSRCRNSDEQCSLTDDCESSLDDSFEFNAVAETAACVEIVTNQVKLYRSQTLRTPKTVTFETEPLSISSSLPNDDNLQLSIEQLNLTTTSTIDQSQSPPKPPNVPATVFAASSKFVSQGMWAVREKVLESLKQKVPRVDVGATSSPER